MFDAWHAGELEPDRERAALEHLANCQHCSARREHLGRERARFLDRAPKFVPSAQPAPTSSVKQRRSAWLGGALALAAVLALTLGKLVRNPDVSEGGGTRSKGPAHLSFFVSRGGQVFEGLPGQAVAPGDQLRFAVTSSKKAYVAVFSLDAAGTASTYHPTTGATATGMTASSQHALDSAVELDGVLGKELLFGVFCDAPFPVEPLRRELETKRDLTAPPACTIDRLDLSKERLP